MGFSAWGKKTVSKEVVGTEMPNELLQMVLDRHNRLRSPIRWYARNVDGGEFGQYALYNGYSMAELIERLCRISNSKAINGEMVYKVESVVVLNEQEFMIENVNGNVYHFKQSMELDGEDDV